MAATDPRQVIDLANMSPVQTMAIAATIALNALDGFDVLAISFAAPGIASDWGLDPAMLGIVLSAELVGMALGSVTIGSAADRYGRRPTVIACLILMTAGMLLTSFSGSVIQLCACRVLTGIGIGGMLPALAALVAEHANRRRRSFCLALMVVGYSAGAVVGGSLAAVLLRSGDWRDIFLLGAGLTALFVPLAWVAIPETVHFHVARPAPGALQGANRLLRRIGLAPVDALPPPEIGRRGSITQLFAPKLRVTTLLCVVLYFGHILTFYFAMKWMAKLLVDAGHHPADAAWMLVLVNLAGIAGGAIFGLAGQRLGVKLLAGTAFVGSMLSVTALGFVTRDAILLPVVAALIGIFINSGVVACYGLFARLFPTELRATGSGVVLGLGRLAAILAPMLAGQLLTRGFPVEAVTLCLSLGSLLAAAMLVPLRFPSGTGAAAAS